MDLANAISAATKSPLAMICVSRFNDSNRTPHGTEASGPSALPAAFHALDSRPHEFNLPYLSASHHVLSSLKSTVLLI